MNRKFAGRKLIVATLTLAWMIGGAVIALRTTAVEAAPGANCTYYSSANKTTVVGMYGKDCCNNTVAWGQKTKWSTCGGCFVCTPPPR
ncbi:MAG TPA: DUF6289 family protein [Candidatus Eisenbacteria bacterium]